MKRTTEGRRGGENICARPRQNGKNNLKDKPEDNLFYDKLRDIISASDRNLSNYLGHSFSNIISMVD